MQSTPWDNVLKCCMIYFIFLRFLAFLHFLPIEAELEFKIILQKQWLGKSAFNGKSQVSERGKNFLNSKGFLEVSLASWSELCHWRVE